MTSPPRPSDWRLSVASSEAIRNLTAGGVHTLFTVVAASLVFASLAFWELFHVSQLVEFQQEVVRAGGTIVVVRAQQPATLSAERCAALSAAHPVIATGATTTTGVTQVGSAPGTLFQTAAVTPGLLTVWGGEPFRVVEPGLVVGPSASAALGIGAGGLIRFVDQERPSPVVAVVDTHRRYPEADRWILSVVPAAGPVEECWVEFASGTEEAGIDWLTAAFFDGSGSDVAVRRHRTLDEFARNPAHEFDDRPQRQAWQPGGVLMAAMLWMTAWFRRRGLGLYRAVGTPTGTILLMGQVEAVLVLTVTLIGGTTWGVLAATIANPAPIGDTVEVAVRTVTSAYLLALLLGPPAWAIAGRGTILSLLKEG